MNVGYVSADLLLHPVAPFFECGFDSIEVDALDCKAEICTQ